MSRILFIELFAIRVPLVREYSGSHYRMTHRSTLITRVHLDNGVIGEAYNGDEDDHNLAILDIIESEIAPLILNGDALSPERLSHATRKVTYNILRDRKISQVARACVDAAIWDAFGKTVGQPLWRLWGGYRQALPIISTAGYYDTGVPIPDQIARLKADCVAGAQFKVGRLSPREDAARYREARRAAGDDFALVPDANQAWSLAEALEFIDCIRDEGAAYFEEPCCWFNDRRLLADIRRIGRIRTCAGQSETSPAGCRDLVTEGAIDVCNFDSSWGGGPTEWRRVAAHAHLYDVQMTHHEEPQISSHLLASIPNGLWIDSFDSDRDPLWFNLIGNRPKIEGGMLHLTERPGFGWDIDWNYVRCYQVAHRCVYPDKLSSDFAMRESEALMAPRQTAAN